MKIYPYTFESWPRSKAGDPMFTCSEQAIYFAHLVSDRIEVFNKLTGLRKRAYNMCKPVEFETEDLINHIIELIEELVERCDKHQNKVDELLNPINELQAWIRPFQ